MKTIEWIAAVGLCLALVCGCSETTKQEAKEALEATGEAAKAAAEDTKANVKKAGDAIEAGVDEFRTSPPADDPVDADAVPEAEESQP
jgi:hypothetical protein